jgi:4-amino-4-deoxy-L-arabinose transferase-like glycosyltransferase
MNSAKINANKILTVFLLSHFAIWVLVPSITNHNLPLDTIEALAWGSNLDWGFNKHPPLSAFAVEVFYQIFGSQDWAYYFLSQIFVITSFFVVWKFSEYFFQNKIYSLIAVLLLEGIYFYNYTTPEFNVYVCELAFWALTVYYCWKGFEKNDYASWLLFGFFSGLGVLSHYLFIYLLCALDVFFIYLIINKKINFKCLISYIPFLLVLLPHLIWLTENNYITITYALHRTGLSEPNFLDHFIHPLIFLGKQIGILAPFFLMVLLLVAKLKTNFNFKDKKLLFLLTINIIPIILMFLTSMLMGVKVRTMWMTPFYLFFGVLLIYIFQSQINLNKLKYFVSLFLILFIFSPFAYAYISITQTDKRTDYPGKEHAIEVQKRWDKKFESKINVVLGNEWLAGNLSYHLKSRPRWEGGIENYLLTGDKMCFRTNVCLGDK